MPAKPFRQDPILHVALCSVVSLFKLILQNEKPSFQKNDERKEGLMNSPANFNR